MRFCDRRNPRQSESVGRSASLRTYAFAIVLLALAPVVCSDGSASARRPARQLQPVRPAIGQPSSVDLRGFIGAVTAGRDPALGAMRRDEWEELQNLYQPDESPLWLDAAHQPTDNARDALTLLKHAADDGLDPLDYYQDLLGRLTSRLDSRSSEPSELARFDVALSAGMLRYLRHLHMGRVEPRTIGFRLERPAMRTIFRRCCGRRLPTLV